MREGRISILILGMVLLLCACTTSGQPAATAAVEENSCPTPEAGRSVSQLIDDLEGDDGCARLSAAWSLAEMGEDALPAVPELTANLYHDGHWEIRRASAVALGRIGRGSKSAEPVLIAALLGDFVHVRIAAAEALARIGSDSAVPALALALQDTPGREYQDIGVQIAAAEALGVLVGHDFLDSGGPGYELSEDGTPIIVLAARNWWSRVGQHRTWVAR